MAISPTKNMKFKLNIIIFSVVLVAFVALIVRIVYIACFAEYDGVKYGVKAYNQQLGADTINANRGTIYDRNMTPLAQSATVWTVSVAPNQITTDEQRQLVAQGLSDILGLDYNEVLEKTKKNTKYEIIKKKVEKPEADKITAYIEEKNKEIDAENEQIRENNKNALEKQELKQKVKGIHMVEDSKRYYPQANSASHIIGFTGSDNQGLYGVELAYDEELSGTPGKVVIAQNALGGDLPFDYEYYYPAQDGNSLVLTVDETLQHYLDKAIQQAIDTHHPTNRVAGVMMDVNTGEILAMSTNGGYDLNDPYTISDTNLQSQLEGLQGDELTEATKKAREKMWTNKVITETYEPGSVFKVVTASAALEEKTQTLDSTFNCTGSIQVVSGAKPIHCWKTSGHGSQNFTQAVVNSCNPAFVQIGQSLGSDLFFQYFKLFGMTEATGIDLPGENKYPLYYTADQLGPAELASEAFGQSMGITPMQMMTAFSATVNGGYMVTPHVVKQIIDQDGNITETNTGETKRQAISEETSEMMRGVLEQVVSANGGSNASVPGYRIAGKSGTAQKLSYTNATGDVVYVSSFVGCVPADDPQFALLILVDEPRSGLYYGSAVASPVFAQVMSDAIPYMGISPEYTEEELQNQGAAVPSVEGSNLADAQTRINSAGLVAETIGSGGTVVKQIPSAGSKMLKGGKVILYTEEQETTKVTVPDVIGKTQAEVNQILAGYGLNIALTNSGIQNQKAKATTQSPPAGTEVEKGSVVTVEFLTNDETG
ncbi:MULTISPECIES: penicillin-binding transpeptidase domain-containing protein [Clostridiaceae]|uniref:PASTA domain-containing protein n=1 Tax=Clostridium facile TaxID=2763035 RepID=A0ABR7IQG7_9CLOT|nr:MULTISPECIES: penicillin-binding transpeptidase domain-containing protein [Clostridiaceae]MBC5787396.1 PASTA domain-containing protein [Clostridium facile]